jgi:hypothetical protein
MTAARGSWQSAQQPLDVICVPPTGVVRQMLTTAKVGRGDIVFDLGSGDGRIPIAAVRTSARPGRGHRTRSAAHR